MLTLVAQIQALVSVTVDTSITTVETQQTDSHAMGHALHVQVVQVPIEQLA